MKYVFGVLVGPNVPCVSACEWLRGLFTVGTHKEDSDISFDLNYSGPPSPLADAVSQSRTTYCHIIEREKAFLEKLPFSVFW